MNALITPPPPANWPETPAAIIALCHEAWGLLARMNATWDRREGSSEVYHKWASATTSVLRKSNGFAKGDSSTRKFGLEWRDFGNLAAFRDMPLEIREVLSESDENIVAQWGPPARRLLVIWEHWVAPLSSMANLAEEYYRYEAELEELEDKLMATSTLGSHGYTRGSTIKPMSQDGESAEDYSARLSLTSLEISRLSKLEDKISELRELLASEEASLKTTGSQRG